RCNQRYLLFALSERRHVYANDIESVKEIFSEAPLLYSALEIGICSCQNAHVHFEGLRLSEWLYLARFEEAQQFRLHLGTQIAYLVEKESPSLCSANNTLIIAGRPCKSAASMAEELAVDQFFRSSSAVEW